MAGESFVQVSPDSSGKRVRNESIEMPQADGTTQTVQMQIVRLSEADRALFEDMAMSLKRVIAALIMKIHQDRHNPDDDDITIEDLDALTEDL